MPEVSNFIERIKAERLALAESLSKLQEFIEASDVFPTLSVTEQTHLVIQEEIMSSYVTILTSRIKYYEGLSQ